MYHLGIIPDGNRRWAIARGLDYKEGHRKGADKLEMTVEWALRHPEINIMTVYCLSEENYRRSQEELDWIYKIETDYLYRIAKSKVIHDNKVNVKVISTNPTPLPDYFKQAFNVVEDATRAYTAKKLYLLIGYTGQSEIRQAVAKIMLNPFMFPKALTNTITDSDIENNLLVKEHCDFIIRTGTEEGPREAKSGFLLWQSAYAEYFHLDKYWPEITLTDVNNSWKYFKSIRRLLGK